MQTGTESNGSLGVVLDKRTRFRYDPPSVFEQFIDCFQRSGRHRIGIAIGINDTDPGLLEVK